MRELSNREKIEELIDGIFLLNHNIVSRMIRRYESPEKSESDSLDDMLENTDYKKLGEYYANLRKLIREGIVIQEKMVVLDYEDFMEDDTLLQMQDNEGQTCKDGLTREMEERIDELFVSLNIIPLEKQDDGKTRRIPDFYEKKKEKPLRMLEYEMLKDSIERQVRIVEIEDYFRRDRNKRGYIISPLITSYLIKALGDIQGVEAAENQCEEILAKYRGKSNSFDQYPEIRNTIKKMEYLRLEKRYCRKFNEMTGFLCDGTSYTSYVMDLYNEGSLPFATQLSQDEIDERINRLAKYHSDNNNATIKRIISRSKAKSKERTEKKSADENLARKGKKVLQDHSEGEI